MLVFQTQTVFGAISKKLAMEEMPTVLLKENVQSFSIKDAKDVSIILLVKFALLTQIADSVNLEEIV